MASIGPQFSAHLLAKDAAAERESSTEPGPSIGPMIPPAPTQTPPAIIAEPTVPVPRYEEEEDEEEDAYAPELPPDLAVARANPTFVPLPPPRRPIGPARGPLQQREEEEEESEEEIGPAPPPGTGPSSHVHEDAIIEFMQKEAQRRQAIEVRFSPPPSGFSAFVPLCACVSI